MKDVNDPGERASSACPDFYAGAGAPEFQKRTPQKIEGSGAPKGAT